MIQEIDRAEIPNCSNCGSLEWLGLLHLLSADNERAFKERKELGIKHSLYFKMNLRFLDVFCATSRFNARLCDVR